MQIQVCFLQTLTREALTARLRSFRNSYIHYLNEREDALRSGLSGPQVADCFERTLRKWNACRKRGGVRDHLGDVIGQAIQPLIPLALADVRTFRSPCPPQEKALGRLCEILQRGICDGESASEVGISKGIMLLTKGRFGPAFDSTVRSTFGLDRIKSPEELIQAYRAVADDLRVFEQQHGPIEGCIPAEWAAKPAIGRTIDMVAGPRQ